MRVGLGTNTRGHDFPCFKKKTWRNKWRAIGQRKANPVQHMAHQ